MSKKPKTKRGRRRNRRSLRVLFTCVGRRVELLNAFRRAGESIDINLEIHGADASRRAPAMHLVDKAHIVPPITSGDYIDALCSLVRRARIDLLIPLLDVELIPLADAAPRFNEVGCRTVISSPRVIRICRDKLATFDTLSAANIDTPQTWAWPDIANRPQHTFPYFMKPRAGSAAKGNYMINNVEELHTLGARVDEPIVQEFVDGIEHTLDVYTGFDGVPRCVVPRRRLEVRSGEVSKAVIVKDLNIMAIGQRVAEALGECRGVITVQCMVTPSGRIRVIEINPRFGGGAPLAIHAGADFPAWLMAEHLGDRPRITMTGYKNDVAMLRYDESVFVPNATRRLDLRKLSE
jgi:carbamoyl-phosphate synthase large subunit